MGKDNTLKARRHMTKGKPRWAVLSAIFTAIVAFGVGAACAQVAPQPPLSRVIDKNNVDLMALEFVMQSPSISTSGISRSVNTGRGMYYDDLTGVYFSDNTITYGGVSRKLSTAGGASVSINGNYYTVTDADGTISVYDSTMNTIGLDGQDRVYAMLVKKTKPDGEVLNYYYKTAVHVVDALLTVKSFHLTGVTSSLGWTVKYDLEHKVFGSGQESYTIKSIYIVNSTRDYCDPTSEYPCTSTNSSKWPKLGAVSLPSVGPTGITYPSGASKTFLQVNSDKYNYTVGSSVWQYVRTSSGGINTITVTNPDASQRIVTYDTKLLTDQDELGRKSTYTYYTATDNAGGYLDSIKLVISPDATWNGSTPTGGYTQYKYDSRNNVIEKRIVAKAGSGLPDIVTSATYLSACTSANQKYCNMPTTVTNEAGVATTYEYDSNSGGVLAATLPSVNGVAPQTRYQYAQYTPYIKGPSGALVAQPQVWRLSSVSTCMTGQAPACVGTADEKRTVYSYGTNNILLSSVITQLGNANLGAAASATNVYNVSTYSYDINGNIIVADGGKPGAIDETYFFYDAGNRLVGTVSMDRDGTGAVKRSASRISYDVNGNVSNTEMGTIGTGGGAAYSGSIAIDRWTQAKTDWQSMTVLRNETTNYDPTLVLPNIQRRYDGGTLNAVSQIAYDNNLRVVCQAQRANASAFGSLPSSACTLGTSGTEGADRIVQNNYDASGAVTSVVNGYGTTSPITDVMRNYNANGTLAWVEDGKGNRTGYSYDGFDRVNRICYPVATTVHTISTTDCTQVSFDTYGRLGSVSLRDGLSTINLGYDALSRLSSKSGAVSETFSYDNFSQLLTHVNNTTGGTSVSETYNYNALGWLISDSQPLGMVSYEYDAYGRRTKLTYPGGSLYVTYSYNDGDQLTGIYENGSAPLATYTYDDYDALTSVGRGSGYATGIVYDGQHRPQSITNNSSNNPNTVTLGYTALNQIKARTVNNAVFQASGPAAANTAVYSINSLNRITNVNSGSAFGYDGFGNLTSDGSGSSYAYNANNLLTSATQAGVTSSLTYDAENRLYSVTKNGATTKFLYDGTDLIAEYDGNNSLLRRYVHGQGTDNPLVWYEGSGTANKSYLYADERGSVTAVSNSSGAVTTVYGYDEYGMPSTLSGSANSRFRFTGQTFLPEVGLYYYKARMYAPSIGRFLQPDPIGYGDGMNIYTYVGNDPLNRIDPAGLAQSCVRFNVTVPGPTFVVNNADKSANVTPTFVNKTFDLCADFPSIDDARNFFASLSKRNANMSAMKDCPVGNAASLASNVTSSVGTAHDGMEKGIGLLDKGAGHALSHMTTALNVASAGTKFIASRQRHEPLDVSIARALAPMIGSAAGGRAGAMAVGGAGTLIEPGGGTLVGGAIGAVGGGWAGDQVGGWLADRYANSRGVVNCP